MGKVIYGMNVSIDGYVEDSTGSIAFSGPPADDVHRHWNEHTEAAAASLYGRRLFEVMEEPWTAAAMQDDLPDVEAEFARAYVDTPRFVFSDTLESVPSGVELVRSRDAAAVISRLKVEIEGPLPWAGPASRPLCSTSSTSSSWLSCLWWSARGNRSSPPGVSSHFAWSTSMCSIRGPCTSHT